MWDNNGDPFIVMFHNVLLSPDLCEGLFSIITLMNSGHTCLYQKGFFTVCFREKENNAVTLPYSTQRKYAFIGKIKEMSKKQKLPSRNKLLYNYSIKD